VCAIRVWGFVLASRQTLEGLWVCSLEQQQAILMSPFLLLLKHTDRQTQKEIRDI
jgi:hypothetical protein